MSTEIYEGFRFRCGGLLAVHHALQALRPQVEALASESQARWLAQKAVEKLDTWSWYGTEKSKCAGVSPFMAAIRALMSEFDMPARQRRETDFGFEIAVFPISGTEVLGLPFTSQRTYQKLLESQDWYQPYGYWDSTDPDEEVSSEEWEERQGAWDRALPDACGIPSLNGLVATLSLPELHQYCSAGECLPFLPPFDWRVDRLTRHVLFLAYGEAKQSDLHAGNVVEHVRTFDHWLKNEGSGSWDIQRPLVAEQLVAQVTVEVLTHKFDAVTTETFSESDGCSAAPTD